MFAVLVSETEQHSDLSSVHLITGNFSLYILGSTVQLMMLQLELLDYLFCKTLLFSVNYVSTETYTV